jgi:23S rRNA (uracil1939-C5)-methyltransferase
VSELLELAVDSIAAGGDGVARHEGLVVFVPRTAPGDELLARVRVGGRFARGELVELRRASPQRVPPPCEHYVRDHCGGCQIQHLSYEAQLAAKSRMIGDALRRIGSRATESPTVRASERQWRYRRKLTLALRRRGGRWIAGLHPYDAPGQIFDLRDCPITDERVVAIWREIRSAGALLPSAAELRGAVRLLDDGAAFTLEGGTRWPTSAEFFAAVPSLRALWWAADRRPRRLLHDRRSAAVPGASFVQINPAVAEPLRAYLVDRAASYAPESAVDAYAGAGDTALMLAERGVRVTALEIDREAVAYAAGRLPVGSRAVAGPVEERLADALPADVVIVNPPRAGLHERVPALLEGASPRPRALLYVSCNPATLARDIARLPSYRIASVLAFDMFPQTAHVETVCELVPEAL